MPDELFGSDNFSDSLPTAGLPVSQPVTDDPLKFLKNAPASGLSGGQANAIAPGINLVGGGVPTNPYTAGAFTAQTDTLTGEYEFDGGHYGKSQLAVFLLDGMDSLTGSAFHQEAAKRAISNSTSGHLLIDDQTEGAKFSGQTSSESNFNQGNYAGVKSVAVIPGAKYGLILIPDGSLADIAAGGSTGGSRRPLYSMATANPNGMFQAGQLVEAGSNPTSGNTYIFEDLRLDQGSDRDYNDMVIRLRGVSGYVPSIDQYIDPQKDWRNSTVGQLLTRDAEPYVTVGLPAAPTLAPANTGGVDSLTGMSNQPPSGSSLPPSMGAIAQPATQPAASPLGSFPWTYPTAIDLGVGLVPPSSPSQFPIIGVIDTGLARNNPDLDYSKIMLGKDYIGNDADPLLNPGEGNEHGTFITGILAATQNNGAGIDGLVPDARLWVSRAVGSGQWAKALHEYVDYLKAQGQTRGIVNLSFDLIQKNASGQISTRFALTTEERKAIEYARQNNVMLMVAAGNQADAMSALGQAAQEYDNIFPVAAAEQVQRNVALADGASKTSYSSFGKGLAFVAFGGTEANGVWSLMEDGLGKMAGSSIATAKVSAWAAQVWATKPELSYRQVGRILKQTATDLEAPGYDEQTGFGFVNVRAAQQLAKMTEPETNYLPPVAFIPETPDILKRVTSLEQAANFNGAVIGGFTAVQENGGINVRPGPGFGYGISYILPPGSQVEFIDDVAGDYYEDPNGEGPEGDTWYRLADGSGYVWAGYVQYLGEVSTPDPGNGGSDPGNGGVDPGNGGSDPGNGGSDPGNGGVDPGNGGSDPGNSGGGSPPPVPAWTHYQIQAGDTLWDVAQRFLGNGNRWVDLQKPDGSLFSQDDARSLQIGQDVVIPTGGQPSVAPAQGVSGQSREYRIGAGDTLWQIAAYELGDGNRWREIMKSPTGGTFTDAEARQLAIGQSVYLPVVSQPISVPISRMPTESTPTKSPTRVVTLRDFPISFPLGSRNDGYGTGKDREVSALKGIVQALDRSLEVFGKPTISGLLSSALRVAVEEGTKVKRGDLSVTPPFYERFMQGSGGTYTNGVLPPIIQKDSDYQGNLNQLKSLISSGIEDFVKTKSFESGMTIAGYDLGRQLSQQGLLFQLDKPSFESSGTLYVIVHGTQAVAANIENLSLTVSDNQVSWSGDLIYKLYDDFGFGSDDVSGPAARIIEEFKSAILAIRQNPLSVTKPEVVDSILDLVKQFGGLGFSSLAYLNQNYGSAEPYGIEVSLRESIGGTFTV